MSREGQGRPYSPSLRSSTPAEQTVNKRSPFATISASCQSAPSRFFVFWQASQSTPRMIPSPTSYGLLRCFNVSTSVHTDLDLTEKAHRIKARRCTRCLQLTRALAFLPRMKRKAPQLQVPLSPVGPVQSGVKSPRGVFRDTSGQICPDCLLHVPFYEELPKWRSVDDFADQKPIGSGK